ncbi:MAG: phosphate-selective outer rane channel, partial [Myxococcales bacterium]|nr:phosphate-selective outer rane channel [Myxococcales bacterium]
GYLEFVDVAQPTAAFSLDRDVGLAVVGRPLAGRLQYQVAILDGRSTPCPVKPTVTLACDVIDPAFAARVVAAPFGPLPFFEGDGARHEHPLVSLGVSGAYGLVPTDVRARSGNDAAALDLDGDYRVDNVSVWQAAAELRAIFRGASLQAEWLGRREHPGAGLPERSFWGAYAQGSYFVIARRLQLAARFSRGDQPNYGVAALERLQRGTRVTEESGAVSFYARGHDAKLQLDYTHRAIPDAFAATSEDRVRVAAQLAF